MSPLRDLCSHNINEMAHTLHLRDYKQQKNFTWMPQSLFQGLPFIIFAVHFTPSSPLSPFPSPWAGCELREGRTPPPPSPLTRCHTTTTYPPFPTQPSPRPTGQVLAGHDH